MGPLTLRAGAGLTALTGPNGSGKSTWIQAAAGLIPLSGGSVRWIHGEKELTRAAMRQYLGYVPQGIAVHEAMTPRGYLEYIGGLKLLDAARLTAEIGRVARLLELEPLLGHARRSMGELSDGQQRRLMIAQALLGSPRLLLWDEPFAGIDLALRRKLQAWLQEYAAATGAAVVISTHDVEEIAPGDYGTVVELGSGAG